VPTTAADEADAPPAAEPAPTIDPVVVTFDAAHAAGAPIGPEGGVLEATAADGTHFVPTIPPDALDFTEQITLTPASRVAALPLSGGMAGSVAIEPAGLPFYVPATLSIEPATALTGDLVGFAYDGDGAEFHLRTLTDPANQGQGARWLAALALVTAPGDFLVQPVPVARGYGAGVTTAAEAATLAVQPLADPSDALETQTVAAEYTELFTPGGAARYQYKHSLEPKIEAAMSNHPPETVDAIALELDRWLDYVHYWHLDDEIGSYANYATQDFVGGPLARAAEAAHDRCVSAHRPEEAFRLVRWRRYALKFFPESNVAGKAADWIAGCLTFKVTFTTYIDETNGEWGWHHALHGEWTLKGGTNMRATGSGPLIYDSVKWIGEDLSPCVLDGGGVGDTFDASMFTRGLAISPVSRTSPAVNITFTYDPGTPGETKSIQCPDAPGGQGYVTHWHNYYWQLHDSEVTDAGIQAQATVVGAGTFEGWVYNQTGMGTQAPLQEETTIEIKHTPQ
jgi:hypothetical protein